MEGVKKERRKAFGTIDCLIALAAITLMFAGPIEGAQPALNAELVELGPSPLTAGEALSCLDAEHAAAPKPARALLHAVTEGASNVAFLFGAANAAGQFGAYYRSDLFYSGTGVGNGQIVFDMWVLPANMDNTNTQGRRYSVADNSFGIFRDVVGTFGFSGAATVMVSIDRTATTAIGAYSRLSWWGRTYTASPSGGVYSTTMPVTTGWLISASTYTDAPGVVQSADKRTNVNAFNHSGSTITCRVDVYSQTSAPGTFYLTIPPYSSVQRGMSDFSIPEPGGDVVFSLSSGYATAFAVTVDNATNDGDARLASFRQTKACEDISGTWASGFANRCGAYDSGYVVVSQTGCTFTAATAAGYLTGTLNGSNGTFTIAAPSCSGSITGNFRVFSSNGIAGTYSGSISGANCCGPVVSGAIVLGR